MYCVIFYMTTDNDNNINEAFCRSASSAFFMESFSCSHRGRLRCGVGHRHARYIFASSYTMTYELMCL